MRIAMIGTGYVGLVSAACFAEFGVEVAAVDKDAAKIEALRGGRIPIYEPGLEDLVKRNVETGRLTFTRRPAERGARRRRGVHRGRHAVAPRRRPRRSHLSVRRRGGDRPRPGRGHAWWSPSRPCRSAPGASCRRCSPGCGPTSTSKSPPIRSFCARARRSRISCARTGWWSGSRSEHARQVLERLYRPLNLTQTPILFTSLETAELIKYATNSFLATKVTFINEMADLCERVGADVQVLAKGLGSDRRIGTKFLHPGPGFGGSCFPKDTTALLRIAEEANVALRIVESVVAVNEGRKRNMVRRIVQACGGSVRGMTIAILGVTFKPNTDDVRDSPSLVIVPALQAEGATVRAHDPEGMAMASRELPQVVWCEDVYDAMDGADAMVILTEWNAFRALDLKRVRELLRRPIVVDLRNVYDPAEMIAAGFSYSSIGRPVLDLSAKNELSAENEEKVA